MSRTALPFNAGDISALARSLRAQLAERDKPPGHVELLNILAKATGFRNFQHLRADAVAQDRLDREQPPPVDHAKVLKLVRRFDREGALKEWPAKLSEQQPCLWVLWSRLPAKQTLSEDQINRALRANHRFGDHALLRRELCDLGVVTRTADGREYRRVEKAPPAEAAALIRHLGRRPRADGRSDGGAS